MADAILVDQKLGDLKVGHRGMIQELQGEPIPKEKRLVAGYQGPIFIVVFLTDGVQHQTAVHREMGKVGVNIMGDPLKGWTVGQGCQKSFKGHGVCDVLSCFGGVKLIFTPPLH